MNTRTTIWIGTLIASLIFSVGAHAQLGGLLSGGGGGNYKAIAEQFLSTKGQIVAELQVQKLIEADISEALDMKSEAEALRLEAKKLEEFGDAISADELDAIKENSATTNAKIMEKLETSEDITDEQKQQLGEAASKYLPSVIRGVRAAQDMRTIVERAGSLGKPGVRDLMGLGSIKRAITEIPSVGPDLIGFIRNSLTFGRDMVTLLNTNGIAKVDTDEIDDSAFDI